VTFINSVLSPLIIYALCVLKIPLKNIEFIDGARRYYLWRKSDDTEEKTYSLDAWDLVCQRKKNGGLCIIDLKVRNKGLLLKFRHKLIHRHDNPWVMIIREKYYQNFIPFWCHDIFTIFDIDRGITE
jgi:hypothetical protein